MKRLLLALLLWNLAIAAEPKKLLVLIIASDQNPVYLEEQELWRSYMHKDRDHVEAYFIKGNPDLKSEFEIDGDVIWSKTAETITPGVLNKTVLSLEALFPRLDEFDFVLRTNLSSFFNFPKMLKFLETLPKTKCYAGLIFRKDDSKHLGWPTRWIHGSGYVISPDVAKLIVANKKALIDSSIPDDLTVAEFFEQNGIPMTEYKFLPIGSMKQWLLTKDSIPERFFQFRLKQWDSNKRAVDEPTIMRELIEKFYQKNDTE